MRGRSWTVANWVVLAFICVCFSGCSFFKPKEIKPTNSFRSEASGLKGTGWDSRARQIESNLGVR